MTENLLSPKETAERLGIKTQTLASWRCLARYNLPFIRIGRTVRYKSEDIQAFIADHTVVGVGGG